MLIVSALQMLVFDAGGLQIRQNGVFRIVNADILDTPSPGLLQATIIANPNTNPMKRYRFIAAKIMKKRH